MTAKQLHFARCVADGMSQAQAYREAYDVSPNSSKDMHASKGSELMRRGPIRDRVNRLIREKELAIANRAVSDRERVTEKLRDWMNGEGQPTALQVRSAELLGKASGLFARADEDARQHRNAAEVMDEIEQLLDRLDTSSRDERDMSEAVDAEWTEVAEPGDSEPPEAAGPPEGGAP